MYGNLYPTLHPELQPLAIEWLNECLKEGLHVRIIQTWRDPLYQDKLFAQGRTRPGNIATDLTGKSSLHCFTIDGQPASKAFDFACFDKQNSYITHGTDPAYSMAGNIGVHLGLIWGGNWTGFKDYDHLQLAEESSTAPPLQS